jgi:hypothetical protein
MNTGTGAILIAVVGVLGTLTASIVTQGLAARSRREDFELQRAEREESRRHEQDQLDLSTKRSSYVAFLASGRRFRHEITNYLYTAKRDALDNVARTELEEARRAYVLSYAEVQISASLSVLALTEQFNRGLANVYRIAKRLGDKEPEPGESIEKAEHLLQELWTSWDDMRGAMRNDLGIID